MAADRERRRRRRAADRAAAARAQPEPARPARARRLRHRHARRPRRHRRAGRGRATGWPSSTCSRTTRATWSTPSTPPGAAARPSSSTPAPSPTTPGRSTTRSPPSTARSSSCTCRTRTPASRGATLGRRAGGHRHRSWASAATATGWPSTPSPRLLSADELADRPSTSATAADGRGRRARRRLRAALGATPGATRCSSPSSSTSATSPASPARPAVLLVLPDELRASSPTAATATRPPRSSPPPGSTAASLVGRSQAAQQRRCWSTPIGAGAPARPRGRARVLVGPAAAFAEAVRRRRAGAHRRPGRGAAPREGRRRGRPHRGGRRHRRRPPSTPRCALLADEPTEAEFGLALDTEMRRLGAEGTELRDDRGRRARTPATPHHRPDERRIGDGDLVVLDFGALVDGYYSDMTRTVVVGDPSPEQRRAARRSSPRPRRRAWPPSGRASTPSDVDAACRAIITAAGWGDAVHPRHRPRRRPRDPRGPLGERHARRDRIAAGVVVTVEPGVYLARTAASASRTPSSSPADGCRPLTKTPKDLACLPSPPTTSRTA